MSFFFLLFFNSNGKCSLKIRQKSQGKRFRKWWIAIISKGLYAFAKFLKLERGIRNLKDTYVADTENAQKCEYPCYQRRPWAENGPQKVCQVTNRVSHNIGRLRLRHNWIRERSKGHRIKSLGHYRGLQITDGTECSFRFLNRAENHGVW